MFKSAGLFMGVRRAVAKLPPNRRRVVEGFLAGKKFEEIVGTSRQRANNLFHRSFPRLISLLAEKL
jgi:hypothetical protein